MKNNMEARFFITIVLGTFYLESFQSGERSSIPKNYKGIPFLDSFYKAGPQMVPGRVECKYFDQVGEGIGYHDTDSINKGSGEYNYKPGHCDGVSDYVCHFRDKESVDLSFTKEFLDFSHSNPYTPERKQGFIGWTKDGEWYNYTLKVKKSRKYKVGILYSNQNVHYKLAINGLDVGEYQLPLATVSYHAWNYTDDIGVIDFPKQGLNLLNLKYMGGANYAYLTFIAVD